MATNLHPHLVSDRVAQTGASPADSRFSASAERRGAGDGWLSPTQTVIFTAWVVVVLLMLAGIAHVARTQVSKGQAFQYAVQPATASGDAVMVSNSNAQRADLDQNAGGFTQVSYLR